MKFSTSSSINSCNIKDKNNYKKQEQKSNEQDKCLLAQDSQQKRKEKKKKKGQPVGLTKSSTMSSHRGL